MRIKHWNMFPSVSSNGRVNDDSTATFVSNFKVTVENGQTAEFDSHDTVFAAIFCILPWTKLLLCSILLEIQMIHHRKSMFMLNLHGVFSICLHRVRKNFVAFLHLIQDQKKDIINKIMVDSFDKIISLNSNTNINNNNNF